MTYPELSLQELKDTLSLTIKKDDNNKVITFLCMLSAYTDDNQLNLSFNAPSSTGKSYIPLEVAKLFPKSDVMSLGHTSPTAFFHDTGDFDEEKKAYRVNLEHKILIFIDQPHNELLERLRPILSHDQKEIVTKITDKNQKFGMRTKTVMITGYPVVVFASAGMRIDEQEGTRFLLLSPDTDIQKLEMSIKEKLHKESNRLSYAHDIESNSKRNELISRIEAIKNEEITSINVPFEDLVLEKFMETRQTLKPRHQRDISRLISIIKSLALLNLWERDRVENTLNANDTDISNAFEILDEILESQEYGLPPYVYKFYQDCILPISTVEGITYHKITTEHLEKYGRPLTKVKLRAEFLPLLESAGFIYQEYSKTDGRERLVFCRNDREYSDDNGGVNSKDVEEAISIFGADGTFD